MIQTYGSCDESKLKKVLIASRAVMKGFYGLTKEDKEDILLDVAYRFEVDKAKFPTSVYALYCRNKVIGFLCRKTAKKRMFQTVKDGKVTYYENISLSTLVGEDADVELEKLIPAKEERYSEVDFLVDIERKAPELYSVAKAALNGERISKKEKEMLKKVIKRGDLVK